MRVKIITGFRGKETNEQYLEPGTIWECDDSIAARLIGNGQAEEVKEKLSPPPAPAPELPKANAKPARKEKTK